MERPRWRKTAAKDNGGDGPREMTPENYLRLGLPDMICSRALPGTPFHSFSFRPHPVPHAARCTPVSFAYLPAESTCPNPRYTSEQSKARPLSPIRAVRNQKMPSHRCAGWHWHLLALTVLLSALTLAPPAACADAESPPLLLHREVQAVSETHATQFGACAHSLLLQKRVPVRFQKC